MVHIICLLLNVHSSDTKSQIRNGNGKISKIIRFAVYIFPRYIEWQMVMRLQNPDNKQNMNGSDYYRSLTEQKMD